MLLTFDARCCCLGGAAPYPKCRTVRQGLADVLSVIGDVYQAARINNGLDNQNLGRMTCRKRSISSWSAAAPPAR
jgi:hypothetical protein